jgi:predicted double-glycine peptidase
MRNVAVLALAAWLLASSTVEATDATTRPRLLPLPDVRQHTNYACGAGALQAVLAYYGVDVRGDTLMANLGTDDKIGTRWWEIVRVAKEHGLEAASREHMTSYELARHLDRGEPVLMPIQAWLDDVPPDPGGWAAATEWGHYVVAVGYDTERFYFEDPAMFGVGYIPRAELEARWHDFDEFGTRLEHFGIVFWRLQGPDALVSQTERIE